LTAVRNRSLKTEKFKDVNHPNQHVSIVKYEERKKKAYKNQSTDRMSVISSIGKPTAVSTIVMVTRPACGTPAAPMAAAVDVRLQYNEGYGEDYQLICTTLTFKAIFPLFE
jgi:hypothetical protein